MQGVNVDPLNPGGAPTAAQVTAAGFDWVRLVSRYGSGTESYISEMKLGGIRVLAVIAAESELHIVKGADLYQVGNEPDIESDSSWTMSPARYLDLWDWFREASGGAPAIVGGQASGLPQWWSTVAPFVGDAKGFAVHPYAKDATDAAHLLASLRALAPAMPLYVTEWNRPLAQVPEFARMLRQAAAGSWWFCWDDAMVPPFGLSPALKAAFLKEASMLPKFNIGEGFANRIAERGLIAKSDEVYFASGLSIVLTDKGPLWYTQATNEVLGPF